MNWERELTWLVGVFYFQDKTEKGDSFNTLSSEGASPTLLKTVQLKA